MKKLMMVLVLLPLMAVSGFSEAIDVGGGGDGSSYGPFVPGEKVSLTIPALIGYAAKGLPSGLKLDKKTGEITGAAKNPTGEAGVTVTFTKKDEPTLTAQFVVGPIPTISVTLEGDSEKCKVTGANKAYLVGKKVSLQAKGPKGTAFVGWFRDGEPWPSEEEFLEPKIKYEMMAEDLDLVACFEKEKMSIDASALESATFAVGAEVAEGAIMINVETQSGLKSLKASKLPSGLKLKQDKKTGIWSVYGTPKKAGANEVKLTATAKSGAVETLVVPVTVGDKEQQIELPEWAVGAFQGVIVDPKDDNEYGSVYASVSEAGRIQCRIEAGGKTYVFDAERFDSKDRNGDFHVNMRTKDGDECTIVLESAFHDIVRLVAGDDDPYAFRNGLFKPAGRQTNYEIDLWRNEHDVHGRLDKDRSGKARRAMEAVKALGGQVLGDYDPAFGDAVLSVQANGTVIVSGALADGTIVSESGFLSIDDDDYWVVCDLVHYDAQTGNVYDMNFHWLPEFDRSGQVIGWTPGRWTGSFIYIYPFR